MPLETLLASFHFRPKIQAGQALDHVAAFLAACGSFQGSPLVPFGEEQEEILRNRNVDAFASNGNTIILEHAGIGARLNDEPWMVQITLGNEWDDASEIQINPTASAASQEAVQSTWEFFDHTLPIFARETHPSLGMANGMKADEGTGELPSPEDLPAAAFPKYFTPWVYLGPSLLDAKRREALGGLDAYRTEALGQGWIVQSVKDYPQKPSATFLSQLKNFPGRSVRYKHIR
jgi:hypothetical protein